jgi:hypothetical protein
MCKKTFVQCGCLFVLSGYLFVLGGCESEEPLPRITSDYRSEEPIPQPLTLIPSPKPRSGTIEGIPSGWLPTSLTERRWSAIIIHHSGSESGDAAIFDKWHREGRHWNGIGYDFVIGNGTDSADGQVEVTYRWLNQQTGAHCGGTPGNWANEEGIGICLVGDFNKTEPTPRQMQSLVRLIQFLQSRYGIPTSRVYGHGTTPGARKTDCPGRRFPMAELKAQLSYSSPE